MSMNQNLDGNIILENEIQFSTQDIVNAVIQNPAALRLLSLAIRDIQTKQVRRMGDLYGHRAQVKKPTKPTKMRLT
jgi:3-dehydroquinate dehydratase